GRVVLSIGEYKQAVQSMSIEKQFGLLGCSAKDGQHRCRQWR
ncbi:hypothetical protein CEXT_179651, partial [Caerostris extrusa]